MSTFQEVTGDALRERLGPRGDLQYCMLIFHMNGCGPCRHTMPLFQAASVGASVPFLSIEEKEAQTRSSPDAPSLLQAAKITGFPTILWVDRRLTHCPKFEGERTTARIRAFAEEQQRASIAGRQ